MSNNNFVKEQIRKAITNVPDEPAEPATKPQPKRLYTTECRSCGTEYIWAEGMDDTNGEVCKECGSTDVFTALDQRLAQAQPKRQPQPKVHNSKEGGLVGYGQVVFTATISVGGSQARETSLNTLPSEADSVLVCNENCPACILDNEAGEHLCAAMDFVVVHPEQGSICHAGMQEILRKLETAKQAGAF